MLKILFTLFTLIYFGSLHGLFSQTLYVCYGENLSLYSEFDSELDDCGNGSTLNITASTVPGVNTGMPPLNSSITGSGSITLDVVSSGGTICETITTNIIYVQANMLLTAIPGSCHEVTIDALMNTAGCTYEFTIEGNTFLDPDGNIDPYTFDNGGNQNVSLTVSCGGCEVSANASVNVPGTDADLALNSSSGIFFDPAFGYWVVCSPDPCVTIELSDNSTGTTAASQYATTISPPVGPDISINSIPNPYNWNTCNNGLATIDYSVNTGGCLSTVTYGVFVSNPNVSTQLAVPLDVPAINCEGDLFEVSVCETGCENNPPGTIYTVELPCSNFYYETTVIPFTLNIPLLGASCGLSCPGSSSVCACQLIVSATRPCVDPLINSICPFPIEPQPDATFDIIPADPADTYCLNENITCAPQWSPTDCNGFNPAPSICEIQNEQWSITPAAGWNIIGGSLTDSQPLVIDFTIAGNYTICFDWQNDCGSNSFCQEICVVDSSQPVVTWDNNVTYCVGDNLTPSIVLPVSACSAYQVEWTENSPNATLINGTSNQPTIQLTQDGVVSVEVDVTGGCTPYSETVQYTVCDTPTIAVLDPTINTCLGAEFCLSNAITIDWNNCTGDVEWTVPNQPGSPFTNPIASELCFTWNTTQSSQIDIVLTNECGTSNATIDLNVTASPACQLIQPNAICQGDQVNIGAPQGSVNATWYYSTDNINFVILPGGMPHTPSTTTWYYVTSEVGGCPCVSDTVEVIVFELPPFTIETSSDVVCVGQSIDFSLNPIQSNVSWQNSLGVELSNAPTYTQIINSDFEIFAVVTFGDANQCELSASELIDIAVNPITLNCPALPDPICNNGSPIDLPLVQPPGGEFQILDNNGALVIANPTFIDPINLGVGDFVLRYEFTQSGCPFEDTCNFTIDEPAPPMIPIDFSLCYNETQILSETSGLDGTWSSSCIGSVNSSTGEINLQLAGCDPNDPITIYYSGYCILTDSLIVTPIPIPLVTAPADMVLCGNECDSLDYTISGNYGSATWELIWPGNTLGQSPGELFCPEANGINSAESVVATLTVETNSNPVCSASAQTIIEVIGIPAENWTLDEQQCVQSPIELPALCPLCDSYEITFSQNNVEIENCVIPGAACFLNDTGIYDYEVVLDLGTCADTISGNLEMIDIPFVSFLNQMYDSCVALTEYTTTYNGVDATVWWETTGNVISQTSIGVDTYLTLIDHSGPINTNQVYYDTLFVSNECGVVFDDALVYHTASPDFTIETDATEYCSGDTVGLIISFAQPLTVDSIVVNYEYEETTQTFTLYEIPEDTIFQFVFYNALDTLDISFNAYAYNSCATIQHESNIAHILASDVAADFELPFDPPLCSGDILEVEIYSVGNIDSTSFTSQWPYFVFQEILGVWYVELLPEIPDGTYAINLQEFGLCGSDVDQELIDVGTTPIALFEAADVCLGDTTYFFNTSATATEEATWYTDVLGEYLYGDTVAYAYNDTGTYQVELTIDDPLWCPATFVDEVRVNPLPDPQFLLDSYNYSWLERDLHVVSVNDTGFENDWIFNQDTLNTNLAYPSFSANINLQSNTIIRILTNEFGCKASAIVYATCTADEDIWVPNAFTPDGDNINEFFAPVFALENVEGYELSIFNRWGEKVYQCEYTASNKQNCVWYGNVNDGSFYAPDGIYNWVLKDIRFKGDRNSSRDLQGIVVLLR